MDLTLIPLDDMLPAATVMVVTVTATSTSGKPLDEEALSRVLAGCEMAVKLDEDKRTVLQFVESKMNEVAPNLSAVVGTEIAAKLMGVAGGLLALSRMPSCNIQAQSSGVGRGEAPGDGFARKGYDSPQHVALLCVDTVCR
ncbi:hypothetical protein Vafri_15470 [Volvox africanus]|uniref:Nop domain-containing protein n=1 Tax=Volvox africanus TaxID=51714 RepID=A0A8J4F5K4_9CHLO|nr:hypothetical protein Vafri_15470 [Volvox africanus]